MALVIPRRLVTSSLRSKFLTKIPIQQYHCCIFTQLRLRPKLLDDSLLLNSSKNNNYYNWYCVEPVRQYSSKTSPNINEDDKGSETKKLSIFKRFKQMYRDYWYVLVPVHLVTSAAWLGGFYYLASSGVDVPTLLESMNFNEKIVNSMRNSSMGYFAITYGLYKIATPARYAITLGGTTLSINYLKKWGYIKPMPSKERLKEIYAETKEGMKERRGHLMESVHNLQQTVKETKVGIKEKKDSIVSTVKESRESIKNIKQKVISSATQKNQNKP